MLDADAMNEVLFQQAVRNSLADSHPKHPADASGSDSPSDDTPGEGPSSSRKRKKTLDRDDPDIEETAPRNFFGVSVPRCVDESDEAYFRKYLLRPGKNPWLLLSVCGRFVLMRP